MFKVIGVDIIFSEINTLSVWQLEQMELEVRGLPPADRQRHQTRLKSYQTELVTLEKELVSRY